MLTFIRQALIKWAEEREPDFVIGGLENPYLRRHWLIPRNPIFNIYVHEFLRGDDDRALHDHPWLFNCSWLLKNTYLEWVFDELSPLLNAQTYNYLAEGHFRFRWGPSPHRVQLNGSTFRSEIPCWTLFVTGPRVRKWGFYCPKGWVHWKKFTARDDMGAMGPGCGD